MSNSSICPIDRTLSGAIIAGAMAIKGYATFPKTPSLLKPSDCLMSYPGHSLGKFLPLCRGFYNPSRLCQQISDFCPKKTKGGLYSTNKRVYAKFSFFFFCIFIFFSLSSSSLFFYCFLTPCYSFFSPFFLLLIIRQN